MVRVWGLVARLAAPRTINTTVTAASPVSKFLLLFLASVLDVDLVFGTLSLYE